MNTFVPPPRPAAPVEEPSIGQLVADATRDLTSILRNELALARAEITVDVKKGAKGGAMFAVAAFFGFMGLIFLLHAAAQGIIAAGLPAWAAYLIVTGVLFLLAGILAMMGVNALKRIKGAPKRAIASARETIDVVRQSAT